MTAIIQEVFNIVNPNFDFNEQIGNNKIQIKCIGKLAEDIDIMRASLNLLTKFKKNLKEMNN